MEPRAQIELEEHDGMAVKKLCIYMFPKNRNKTTYHQIFFNLISAIEASDSVMSEYGIIAGSNNEN